MSTITQGDDELTARRQLRAWIRAAEYLNNAGFAAAVPPSLVPPLQRRGLLVWAAKRWVA
jgi:hypothetical protein